MARLRHALPCRSRIIPERVYRTYTESVGNIRLGGLESYEIRKHPTFEDVFGKGAVSKGVHRGCATLYVSTWISTVLEVECVARARG
eukprot:SAG11_NODE_44_length_20765_cov_5.183635_1_plen_87_part_00